MPTTTSSLHDTILSLERQMWDAFSTGDSQAFARLVSPQALMITGGSRSSGAFYAQMVAGVHLARYELRDVAVLDLGPQAAAIHYTVEVVDAPGPLDLSGTYRVSSVWQQQDGAWRLVLNHDSIAVFM